MIDTLIGRGYTTYQLVISQQNYDLFKHFCCIFHRDFFTFQSTKLFIWKGWFKERVMMRLRCPKGKLIDYFFYMKDSRSRKFLFVLIPFCKIFMINMNVVILASREWWVSSIRFISFVIFKDLYKTPWILLFDQEEFFIHKFIEN